jgi:uncharacterized protein (TIGR02246 family)
MEETMSTAIDLGELQTTYDALVEAALAQDVEGYVAQFVEDGVFLLPHSPAVRGRDAMADWLRSYFQMWSMEVDSMSFEGVAIGDRVAFAWYNVTGTYVSTDGERVLNDTKYLDTFVREPGGPWRFAAHMTNSNNESTGIY